MNTSIRVPLFDLDYGEEEKAAVVGVLESKWLTMGPRCEELESEFSSMLGIPFSFTVSNCTTALYMAIKALGIGSGDEVICPSLTFVATANCIRYTGAKPVFADIASYDDWTLSAEDIEKKITPHTRAIVVMHYGGFACRMDKIMELANHHKLFIIEDCAHAPGSRYNDHPLGSFGDVSCFSFFSNKNISAGEGGMVCTRNEETALELRRMRSHGMTSLTMQRHQGHAYSYDVTSLGYNFRFDEMRAALALVQLRKLKGNNQRRNELARNYYYHLRTIPHFQVPFKNHGHFSNFHIFPVILPPGCNRLDIMAFLRDKGIQTSIHYPPVHQFSEYKFFFGDDQPVLPLTESVGRRVLTLPMFPGLTSAQVDYVMEMAREYFGIRD